LHVHEQLIGLKLGVDGDPPYSKRQREDDASTGPDAEPGLFEDPYRLSRRNQEL
jgi:hypothetical protein